MDRKDIERKIRNYGLDVTKPLAGSPFEYLETLGLRSELQDNIDELAEADKRALREYDAALAKRASEFVNFVYDEMMVWDNDRPLSHWWWHLDEVASGKLEVKLVA